MTHTAVRRADGGTRRVVINADDCGLHPAINAGICEAHTNGIVTSTSLMTCGEAFEDAIHALRRCPELDVGVHLTLVGERPILPQERIRSLAPDGTFPASYREFLVRWSLRRVRLRDVHAEWTAQIRRALEAGFRLSHLDSHQHVHCLPGIWSVVVDLAREHNVPFVRRPEFESLTAGIRAPLDAVLRLGVNTLAAARREAPGLRFAGAVRGLPYSGSLTAARLRAILVSLGTGVTEVVVHPGRPDDDLRARYRNWREFSWGAELAILTDPAIRRWCIDSASLTSFRREAAQAVDWSLRHTPSSSN